MWIFFFKERERNLLSSFSTFATWREKVFFMVSRRRSLKMGKKRRIQLRPLLPGWHIYLVLSCWLPEWPCAQRGTDIVVWMWCPLQHSGAKLRDGQAGEGRLPSTITSRESRTKASPWLNLEVCSWFSPMFSLNIVCPNFCIIHQGISRLLIKHSTHSACTSSVSVLTSLNVSCY